MAELVLSNAVILEGEELELTRGYLVIRDGMIEEISEGSPTKRATDLKRGFILPPFVNSHTHVADSVMKELYLGRTQPEVVGPKGEKFRALESSSPREIIAAIRTTLEDMLSTGTLAHCDFREGGIKGVRLLRQASTPPMRSIILGRPLEAKELKEVLAESDGIGLPSLAAFDSEELMSIAKQTGKARKFFSVHAGETRDAQESSLRRFGKSEIEKALELNPSFIVHATHASESEFERLRKDDVPVVFCPRANSLFGVGSPPIHLAIAAGTRFCLGTDNVTACQPDMFEELAFAWSCLRLAETSAGSEEARKLLQSSTIEPLKIFHLPWGPISKGEEATFIVLARRNNLVNLTDVYAGLINRARADNLRAVYLRGQQIKGEKSIVN